MKNRVDKPHIMRTKPSKKNNADVIDVPVKTLDPTDSIEESGSQVEELLPDWERWYPSLFDAASDLGLIRAEVCDPDSLLLTRRHAKIRQRAEDAHREKWGG